MVDDTTKASSTKVLPKPDTSQFVDTSEFYTRNPRSTFEVFLNAFHLKHQMEYDNVRKLQEDAATEYKTFGTEEDVIYQDKYLDFLQSARISPMISPWINFEDKNSSENYKFLRSGNVSSITQDYEVIGRWLMRNQKKHISPSETITGQILAEIATDLLAFQEENLNQNVRNPSMVRVPTRLFFDTRQSGALGYILLAVFRFKKEKNIKNFKFNNPGLIDLHTELFMAIEKQLVSSDFLRRPSIYLSREIKDAKRVQLSEIVRRNQGQITSDKNAATHIVLAARSNYKFSEEAKMLWAESVWRVEDQTDQKWVLMHHVGYPDSFDRWERATTTTWTRAPDVYDWAVYQVACGQKNQSKKRTEDNQIQPWKVTMDWLLDLQYFNEWPNEKDYEVDEKRVPYTIETMKSRPVQPRKLVSMKLLKKTKTVLDAMDEDPDTSEIETKKPRMDDDEMRGADLTNDMEDPAAAGYSKVDPNKLDGPYQPVKGGTLTEMVATNGIDSLYDENSNQGILDSAEVTEQSHHIIVPSYAAWFDYNAIHSIEKRALPEFFNSENESKTPEVFLAYRNFMIDTYRLNPTEYLSATACRRNLAGDVCVILRVHAFLEQWGLVNYQVDQEARPTPLGPPPTSHFHILADTPSGIQPVAFKKESGDKDISDTTEIYRKESSEKTQPEKLSETSTVADLENAGLQADLYRLKAQQDNTNFPKSKAVTLHASKPWSEQECVLLLEGLEMFRDDWNKVSEHVSTRTQDECILQFLRLPIEDPYFEGNHFQTVPTKSTPIPFSTAGNPVMSTVAFLSSVVDPRIAAAAAKAAIEQFSLLKTELPKVVVDAHRQVVQAEFAATKKLKPEVGLADADLPSMKYGEEDNLNSDEEAVTMDTDAQPKATPSTAPTDEDVAKAAAEALSAAAVKATYLANCEERKIQGLVALLVETQIKKVDLKLKNFEQLQHTIEAEREHLETQREQLVHEKQAFHMEQIKAHEARQKAIQAEQHKISQQRQMLQQQHMAMQQAQQVRSYMSDKETGQEGENSNGSNIDMKTELQNVGPPNVELKKSLPGSSVPPMDIDEDTNQSAISMSAYSRVSTEPGISPVPPKESLLQSHILAANPHLLDPTKSMDLGKKTPEPTTNLPDTSDLRPTSKEKSSPEPTTEPCPVSPQPIPQT